MDKKKEEFKNHWHLEKFYLKTGVILKIIKPQKKSDKIIVTMQGLGYQSKIWYK